MIRMARTGQQNRHDQQACRDAIRVQWAAATKSPQEANPNSAKAIRRACQVANREKFPSAAGLCPKFAAIAFAGNQP